MAMKEEAGVLEVDYRSERSRVQVCVLLELEVSRESCAADREVAFEGFKSCVADGGGAEGAGELAEGADNVDCGE